MVPLNQTSTLASAEDDQHIFLPHSIRDSKVNLTKYFGYDSMIGFDGSALRRKCDSIVWQPDVYWECYNNQGGLSKLV